MVAMRNVRNMKFTEPEVIFLSMRIADNALDHQMKHISVPWVLDLAYIAMTQSDHYER